MDIEKSEEKVFDGNVVKRKDGSNPLGLAIRPEVGLLF